MHFCSVCNAPHATLDAELGISAMRSEIAFSRRNCSVQKLQEDVFYRFSATGGGGLQRPRMKRNPRTSEIRIEDPGLFVCRYEHGRDPAGFPGYVHNKF